MKIEITGKVTEITESEFVGVNQSEKYTIVLTRRYLDQNEEEKESVYAIQVFASNPKKSRSYLMYFLGKKVKATAIINSTRYQKDSKVSYFTNINLISMEEVTVNSRSSDSGNQNQKENNQEQQENLFQDKKTETVENTTDDLPF